MPENQNHLDKKLALMQVQIGLFGSLDELKISLQLHDKIILLW